MFSRRYFAFVLLSSLIVKRFAFLLLFIFSSFFSPYTLLSQRTEFLEEAQQAFEHRDFGKVLDLLGTDMLHISLPTALDSVRAQHLRGVAFVGLFKDSLTSETLAAAKELILRLPDGITANDSAFHYYTSAIVSANNKKRQQANTLFEKVDELFERAAAKDTTLWLNSIEAHAYNLHQINNYKAALEQSLLAVALTEKATSVTINQKWYSFMQAAIGHYRIDKFDYGLELAEKCIKLAPKTSDADGNLMAAIYERSLMYGGLKRLEDKAKDQRWLIDNAEAGERGKFRQAVSRHALANTLEAQGKYVEALEVEKKAAEYFETQNRDDVLLRVYYILGKINFRMGQWEAALATTNQALMNSPRADLIEIVEDLPRVQVDSIEEFSLLLQALVLRANILYEQGKFDAAVQDLEDSYQLTEAARKRALLNPKQYVLTSISQYAYSEIVLLYNRLGNTSTLAQQPEYRWKAFLMAEKIKAYSLAAALGGERYNWTEAERQLGFEISQLERDVINDKSLITTLSIKRADLQQLQAAKASVNTSVNELTESAIDEVLSKQDADLLSYYLRQDSFLIFHKQVGESPKIYVRPTPKNLEELVTNWRNAITQGGYKTTSLINSTRQITYDADFLNLGIQLRELVLPPGINLKKRLIISPDYLFNEIPFSALPLDTASLPLDYRAIRYFGDEHLISYAQSASVLLAQENRIVDKGVNGLLAVAPSFRGSQEIVAINELQRSGDRQSGPLPTLRPLKYNTEEVDKISKLVKHCTVLKNEQASKAVFLAELKQASILHLATHGMADTENSEFSFVAFNQSADTLDEEEILFYNELTYWPMNVEMVVLSACETNLGPLVPAEGVLSMANAFTAAGAKATLTTLWSVEDEVMSETMTDFYRGLTQGIERVASLDQAVQARRNSEVYAHPKYWAGLVLHGSAGPVDLAPSGGFPDWLLALLGICLAVGMVLILSDRK
jgi:CHAT domain-containing protein